MTCINCAYFYKEIKQQAGSGECRFSAPKIEYDTFGYIQLQKIPVPSDYWCGDHTTRSNSAAQILMMSTQEKETAE